METSDYEQEVLKYAVYGENDPHKQNPIVYPVIGMANEAGEALGKIKKYLRSDGRAGPESDVWKMALVQEIGDVLWYATAALRDLGFTLEDAMTANQIKLARRFAEGKIRGDGDDR